jgi:uncharacterized protein YndB with AHSA1/START domain
LNGEKREISIQTKVNAPIERVWSAWISPEEIKDWNFAPDVGPAQMHKTILLWARGSIIEWKLKMGRAGGSPISP